MKKTMLNIITVFWNKEMFNILENTLKDDRIRHCLVIGSDRINKIQALNNMFQRLSEKDDYFMIVDNDTIFHPNALNIYESVKNSKTIVIGQQLYHNDKVRLQPHIPQEAYIDTGSCMCHCSALKQVKWGTSNTISPDADFWKDCYRYFGTNIITRYEPISYYNYQIKQEIG